MLQKKEKRWVLANRLPEDVDLALHEYPIPIRQILFNRGCRTNVDAKAYLEGDEPEGDPYLLIDMAKAVERVETGIRTGEKIVIYGDYDVDGVTATALLVEVLRELGGCVEPYIPNRFEEGYGLNNDALASIAETRARLVITVDCGIRSPSEVEYASSLGMDIIITDHHHPKEILPPAYAVICQKRIGDKYPNKNLAGVGLAYKLAEALSGKFPEKGLNIRNWLDLVALGTVADVVPLVDENRTLVKVGLKQLSKDDRLGIRALAGVSRISLARITAMDIGFGLGPRLNAAGRLETALDALNLLLAKNQETASLIAQKLDDQNRERQGITKEMQKLAAEKAVVKEDTYFIFAADSTFNSGVVGLTAARLTENYYRPSAVGNVDLETNTTRCSCRSIPEFHITNALDQCADLLVRHGGHSMAAGFTVKNENLEILIDRLEKIATRELAAKVLKPIINLDVEIPLADLKPDLLPFLNQIQPTGMENPDVVFLTRNVRISQNRPVGADNVHLKMIVTDGRITYDCIGFRQGHWFGKLPERVDIAFSFEVNEFNGNKTLQLNIKDLRPVEN